LSTLIVQLDARARAELTALAKSLNPMERKAAAQLLVLLDLVKSNAAIRDRLLTQYETCSVSIGGSYHQIDIKIIQSLKCIANDEKFHTDAVRRIRDVLAKPGDQYRVFFAPVPSKQAGFSCRVLGVFHRSIAYEQSTLNELKKRYENPL
jgi:hypothetical protein